MVEQVGSAKLAVVADVAGAGDYHLGDEAMLEANLTSLRRLVPDIRFTVFSRDPAWTSRRYSVDAVATSGSLPTSPRRGRRLPGPMPCSFRAAGTVRDLAREGARTRDLDRDGAGSGPSGRPGRPDDRSSIDAEQRTTLGAALSWASWIGVRDAQSAALVTSLGVPPSRIHLQFDDAFLLEPQTVAGDQVDGVEARQPAADPRHARRIVRRRRTRALARRNRRPDRRGGGDARRRAGVRTLTWAAKTCRPAMRT